MEKNKIEIELLKVVLFIFTACHIHSYRYIANLIRIELCSAVDPAFSKLIKLLNCSSGK